MFCVKCFFFYVCYLSLPYLNYTKFKIYFTYADINLCLELFFEEIKTKMSGGVYGGGKKFKKIFVIF